MTRDDEAVALRKKELALLYAELNVEYGECRVRFLQALLDDGIDEAAFESHIEEVVSVVRQMKSARLELSRLKHTVRNPT